MKKLIHQTLALAILSTSFTSFGTTAAFASDVQTVISTQASRSQEIGIILSDLVSNIERGQGERKSLVETTKQLLEKNVSAQELVDFSASNMSEKEAIAFRAQMKSKLDKIGTGAVDSDELSEMVAEVANGARGVNYRSSCSTTMTIAWVAGLTALFVGIKASEKNTTKKHKEGDINQIKLDKVALQGEMQVLINEGLPESSYYVANMKADIAYMDEQIKQAEVDRDKAAQDAQLYLMLTGVTGGVAAVSYLVGTNSCHY